MGPNAAVRARPLLRRPAPVRAWRYPGTIYPRMSRRAQATLGGRSSEGALLARSQSVKQAERLEFAADSTLALGITHVVSSELL